jgi:hypothetical protein
MAAPDCIREDGREIPRVKLAMEARSSPLGQRAAEAHDRVAPCDARTRARVGGDGHGPVGLGGGRSGGGGAEHPARCPRAREPGYATGGRGDRAGARAILDDLRARARERYQPAYEIAKAGLGAGRKEEALDWLERALADRAHSMVFLEVDPQLAPLRGEERFRELVRKVGLPRASEGWSSQGGHSARDNSH